MKKCLYALIIIDIVGAIVGTFFLLSGNVFYAIVFATLSGLNIVPLFAIICCLDSTEQNSSDISFLYYKLKVLEKTDSDMPISYNSALKHTDVPKKPWKCIKCDTVNKAETDICTGCGAKYNYQNPTFDSAPKKKSRFVKF